MITANNKRFLLCLIIVSTLLLKAGCEKEKQSEPPVLSTNDINEITLISAISGGNIKEDGGAKVISRGVCWSIKQNPTLSDSITTDGSGSGSFKSSITGLQANTTYYLRAYAINEIDTAYGEELSFTTAERNIIYGDGVTDIDGNEYISVIIGEQEWMAENLRVTKYNNGEEILTGLSDDNWGNATDGAYAIFDHDSFHADGINSPEEMVETYGKLYNGFAVFDDRGLCPQGWRVPTDTDWNLLIDNVEDYYYPNKDIINGAGNALKTCRQINSILGDSCATNVHPRWDQTPWSNLRSDFGIDAFGFSGLPAGYRKKDGRYFSIGTYGTWWSSSDFLSSSAWYRGLSYWDGHVRRGYSNMVYGQSVRCIRE